MYGLSRNQKIIIIILAILSLVFLVLFLLSKDKQEIKTEPERGGIPSVVIQDVNNELYRSVTKNDYLALKARLTDYVVSQKGDPWTTVKIGNTKTSGQGSTVVSFSATIDSLNQADLKVEFDYAAKPYPTFSIKEKSFVVPLYGGQD